jgi:ABC-type nitrate/sulfonate/bicarbonate transport system permease component
MSDATWWNPYAPLTPQMRRWLGIGTVLAVLLLWSGVAGLGLVSANKLPPPWDVAQAFGYLTWDGQQGRSLLFTATLWSVGRVLAAAALVIAIGIPVGVLMGAAPRINAALSPLIDPFRSAPVVALLPIAQMFGATGTCAINV